MTTDDERHGDGEATDDRHSPAEAAGANDAEAERDGDAESVAAARAADDGERVPDVPEDVALEAERLTRLARKAEDRGGTAPDGTEYDGSEEATAYRQRRDDLLAEHDYECRIRETDDTLVLYPSEWLVDGEVAFDRVDDTDRAVERSLSGAGDEERWADVESHNADLVGQVEREHGPDHAANARAFADFLGNHYAKEVERATAEEVTEFLSEYYPRNAWPTAAQERLVEESVALLFDAAGVEPPAIERR